MFGHDEKDDNQVTPQTSDVVQPMSTTPPDENVIGVPVADDTNTDDASATVPVTEDDDSDISKIVDDINASAQDAANVATPEEATAPEPTPANPEPDTTGVLADNTPSELLEIKKSALQELSPLLDELDQTPEEKLNILIMTIQASDDQSLIPQAFEVAKSIEDKKQRAEAMLDIINEINYFTKKQ